MPSTQDVARARIEDLPVLVIAAAQTEGRGRTGSLWLNADRALAASLAFHHDDDETRPISLMAGVAAVRATGGTRLKWPNDVLARGLKVGGILVEHSGGVTVVGLGLNLWWSSPAEGATALFEADPGEDAHAEIGSLWGAELMEILDGEGWPLAAYREACDTIGREISWEPDGAGRAVDVADDGSLLVDLPDGERRSLRSGAVSHVRA